MGNGKSEIPENIELWNFGTLELWNTGTLEHWNFRNRSLIPYGEKDLVYITTSIVLHPLRGKSVKQRA